MLEVTPSDMRFWRTLRDYGINKEGVCKVFVIFCREGLTDEICYENFERQGAASSTDSQDGQTDWIDSLLNDSGGSA